MIDPTQVEHKLAVAQDASVRASARLRRAQAEALLGIRYDDVAMDRLILSARRTRRQADAAWAAWQAALTGGAAVSAA
jgi:hypothetical protein